MNYDSLDIDLGEVLCPVFIGENLLVNLEKSLKPVVTGSHFFVVDEKINELYKFAQ